MLFQPADWQEHDVNYVYVMDAYGRSESGDVACVRITGFRPFLYLEHRAGDSSASIESFLLKNTGKSLGGLQIKLESHADVMSGYSPPVRVWKLSCPAIWMYKTILKTLKRFDRILYESNISPMIRFFHEREILPASPFQFEESKQGDLEDINVDVIYIVPYSSISPAFGMSIPLYIASYDIETYSPTDLFPVAENATDEIIQIGVSFRWDDNLLDPVVRYVFVSGSCTSAPGVRYIPCKNERELIQKFHQCILDENPDRMCGYNTFGFDDGYIADRAIRLGLKLDFGRTASDSWGPPVDVSTRRRTFELASGTFAVRVLDMPGRMPLDLYLSMRREHNLDSYKLDDVASVFLRDKVVKLEGNVIHTKSTRGLFVGNQVRFDIVHNTINPIQNGRKFVVEEVHPTSFRISESLDISSENLQWCFSKDDLHAHEMFAKHRGNAEDRSVIAKYCIQDCDLVLTLMAKLDTLTNARGMADVCRVPMDYIFLRGQGIKIHSAVLYEASKRNQIIRTMEGIEDDTSYEGGVVLPPKIGMYLDQPISVLDFNSLYPSNMIAMNLSPDTLVYVKHYSASGKLLNEVAHIPDVDEVGYDLKNEKGEIVGREVCGFIKASVQVGLLPQTLGLLLKKRKEVKKLMESATDDAQKSVYNGLQLAYKVVANSMYGQTGSKTSPIRCPEVAACTTAVGRQKIYEAKGVVEREFGARVVAGDTDSIFVQFPTQSLSESIELAKKASVAINAIGRSAHKIEYEKTFYPFILFCRKRYVGLKYENDTIHCERKSMGIATKRRDNAPIVKDIYGGAIDILLLDRDVRKAQQFVQAQLARVLQHEFPLSKYIITKQLRDDYKKPEQIAHAVLAKRMKERDTGSAPQVGDRLAYIYVENRAGAKKQGDRIEQVDYVQSHNLKPDVEFYITNQLQNPLAQLFALALESMEGYTPKVNYIKLVQERLDEGEDEETATLAIQKLKEKELETILFLGARYLKKYKVGPMDKYFKTTG